MNDEQKSNAVANRVLLAFTSLLVFSVVWLYVLEWINTDNSIGPNVKVLVGLVGASVVVTDWLYTKFKKVK